MNSTENQTTQVSKKNEAESITYILVDNQPSAYVMDGPGVDDIDDIDFTPVISTPSIRAIRRTSRVKKVIKGKKGNPETFEYEMIRYIKDCPTIYVKEQDEQGYKPNHLTDIIIFRSGSKTATNEGDTALFKYLQICEYNTDVLDRPEGAEDIFKALSTTKDAEQEETIFDLQAKCLNVLSDLKKEETPGKFKYNTDALEFYCAVFKIPAFSSGFQSEAWVALAKFANQEPNKFLNSIANARAIIEADVYSAINLGVVTIDQQKVYYTDGNAVVMSFEDDDINEEEKHYALVDFMSNPKNDNHYKNLRVKLTNKKNANTGVIK